MSQFLTRASVPLCLSLLLSAVVAVSASAQQQQVGQIEKAPSEVAAPEADASSRFDAQLRQTLHERFVNDARVRSYRINIESVGRQVTLRGVVRSLEERAAAIELATAIPGVVRLVNEITVNADERSDSAIENDVLSRLRSSTAMTGSDVRIAVEFQMVVIDGVFPTLAALDKAVGVVSSVNGVSDIIILAKVQPTMKLPDESVRSAVAKALLDDGRVYAQDIRVGVSNGNVVLEGSAPSLFQISQAEEQARKVTGVKSVKNKLSLSSEGETPVG